MIYVSITGLRLRGVRHFPRFWWHAIRAMAQARRADGNLSVEARTINGVHHTLSVWRNEAAMRAYLTTGAHLRAMKAFRSMAEGRTLGYVAAQPPAWEDVHQLWRTKGRWA